MRVLVVSQYYAPENVPIPASLARGLAERGHTVRVLTGYPNYPAGELFEGYRMRGRMRERIDGIDVLRVPLFVDHSRSAVRRIANYASFGASAATALRFARGADVVYVYATQMTAALGPWIWRLTGGVPYVLHVQDLWPDSIVGSSLAGGRAGRAISASLNPWLRSVYRRAAAVVGIAPSMVDTLRARGVDAARARLVYNWAEEYAGARPPASAVPDRPVTRVVYAGNVGDLQDLETAVTAAVRLRDASLELVIVGDGVALPRLRALADGLGATNVTFRPAVPRSAMPEVYATADFSLVSLKDLAAFRSTIPSKFQGSLAQGMPVVTTVQGDVRRIVETTRIGFAADAESVESLTQAFLAAARLGESERQRMTLRAAELYRDRFSHEAGVNALEQILMEATRIRKVCA